MDNEQFDWKDEKLAKDAKVLASIFFGLNHWIFSWHYFEAACLFGLSFREHSIESLDRLKQRKNLLKKANIAALISIGIISGTLELIDWNYPFVSVLEAYSAALYFLILTFLTLSSMRHI